MAEVPMANRLLCGGSASVPLTEAAVNLSQETLRWKRLGKKAARRRDSHFCESRVGISGHQNHRKVGMGSRERIHELDSVHTWHDYVGDNRLDQHSLIPHHLEGLGSVGRLDHGEPVPLEHAGGKTSDCSLIVDH